MTEGQSTLKIVKWALAAASAGTTLFSSGAFAGGSVDLLDYMKSHVATPSTDAPKYNRAQHFGGWVHQDPNNRCHNTREMALARSADPSVPLQFSASGQQCTITSGLWHDPYTGQDVEQASALQIDHIVPLKEAYYMGASAWAPAIRCNYANFLSNNFQLLVVSGHENMSKGDRGPSGYMPPNPAEHCEYVHDWMMVKAIWNLSTTSSDVQAIEQTLASCAPGARVMDADELNNQRQLAATPIAACANFDGSATAQPEIDCTQQDCLPFGR